MALSMRQAVSVRAVGTRQASRPALPLRKALGVRAQAVGAGAYTVSNPPVTSTNGNGAGYAPAPQQINVDVTTVPGVYAPAQTYENLVKVGAKKAQQSVANLLISGFLAGCYIGLGGFLFMSVVGGLQSLVPTMPGLVKLIGGLVFPVGLTMVILSGTELFTGNTAVIPMSMYEKQATLGGMLHNWFWSWTGNLIGSLFAVAAVHATGVLAGNPVPVSVATMKAVSLPLSLVFIRSILCNWLVCMAVWHAAAATTLPGKMMGLWAPIATFVTIGLEHSVANMFFIPLGMAMGANITWSQAFLNNILPVTLGNTIGGFLFVGTAFAYLHGSLGKPKAKAA